MDKEMKCLKCGCPIIRGMHYMTFEKKGKLGYMCMDCIEEIQDD